MFGFGAKWKGFWRIMATRKRPSVPRKNLCEQKPWEDEVLREVYAVRDAYAAEHGYDLDRIYADLKRREASSRLRRAKARPLARCRSNSATTKHINIGKTGEAVSRPCDCFHFLGGNMGDRSYAD